MKEINYTQLESKINQQQEAAKKEKNQNIINGMIAGATGGLLGGALGTIINPVKTVSNLAAPTGYISAKNPQDTKNIFENAGIGGTQALTNTLQFVDTAKDNIQGKINNVVDTKNQLLSNIPVINKVNDFVNTPFMQNGLGTALNAAFPQLGVAKATLSGIDLANYNNWTEKYNNWGDQKIAENIVNTKNPILRKGAELAPSVAQNLVNAGISAFAPQVGTANFITSAAGSYYREGKNNRGMNEDEALQYGAVGGLVEGGTEALTLGNFNKGLKLLKLGGISPAVLKSFGLQTVEEALQEAITEPATELAAKVINNSGNFENIQQRMIEAGIDGVLSSLILQALGLGAVKLNQNCVKLVQKIENGER